MKTTITLIAIMMMFMMGSATTLTLNNNNPSPGQYVTWIAAHAAANDGDTILIHGSTYNYYSLALSKRLTIIGPGHNPIDKQNSQRAFCDNVLFYTGSNRSKVIGIEAGNMQSSNNDIDSVEIKLCSILDAIYFQTSLCNYWLVDGNVFASSGINVNATANTVGDLVCRNNIFNGFIGNFYGGFIGYNYFNNNIFLANTPYTFQNCQYFYVNSNIFYRSGLASLGNLGIAFTKNCSYECVAGNTFPNGVNYEGVDPLFVTSIGSGAYFSYSTDYHLQANSPLINAGGDGTDVGVYGGYGDFNQYGVSHNPYVKTFNITGPTSVNAGTPLQIYLKAKVRN